VGTEKWFEKKFFKTPQDEPPLPQFECCLCTDDCDGYGHNPYPLVDEEGARCCDDCNAEEVIPARLTGVMSFNEFLNRDSSEVAAL